MSPLALSQVDDRTYQPLTQCPSSTCVKNDIKGKLHQLTRGSKFVRYQEIKLQELVREHTPQHAHTQPHIQQAVSTCEYGIQLLTCDCHPFPLFPSTPKFPSDTSLAP